MYGCKTGYTQALITLFSSANSPFELTSQEISWIASVSYTGTLISVVISFTLGQRVSRRLFLFGCTLVFATAWLLILITSSVAVIIGCLFVYGVAASMMLIIGFVYFSEIASPKNRETLGLLYGLAGAVGVQVEFPLLAFGSYRLLVVFPVIVSIIALLLFSFMVESPYYLLSKGLKGKTVSNLCWLNAVSDPEEVAVDIQNIKHYIDEQKDEIVDNWRLVVLPENLKLLLAMVVITAAGRINCTAIVWQYGSTILNSFESTVNGKLFVNTFNSLYVCGTILSLVTIKKFQRRPLLLYGFFAGGVIQLACAFCYYVEEQNANQLENLAVGIALLLLIFLAVNILTYGPALSILKSEVFPHNLKEFYTSVLAFTGDTVAFVTVKSYFSLSSSIGIHYILVLHTCISFVGAVFVYIFIRDTKGKTLYQIRTEYASVSTNDK